MKLRPAFGRSPRLFKAGGVEVIVAENASGDGVGEVIRRVRPSASYLELAENLGFGKANNLAFENSSGEFVLFLNPDTIANEAALSKCLERLQCDESIGVISPKLVMLNGEMDLACRRSIPTVWDGFCRASGLAAKWPKARLFAGYNLTHLPDTATYDVGAVNGAFMLCPRRALIRVGVFDEQFFMYGEDLDLCHRFRAAGYRVVYEGRVEMIHLKGTSSSKDAGKMAKTVFSSTKQFYLKHFNPRRSIWVRWKYELLFGAWAFVSSLKAKLRGYERARPL